MRRLALFMTYVLVVVPYGLVRRLFRDPLARRWEPERDSYFTHTHGRG